MWARAETPLHDQPRPGRDHKKVASKLEETEHRRTQRVPLTTRCQSYQPRARSFNKDVCTVVSFVLGSMFRGGGC